MSNIKRMYKFYTPDMYDKEEKFLTEMSLQGWHFESFTPPCSYLFVKGQPKPYIYKLDFRKNRNEDWDNYKTLYEDCGWEHVQEFRVFRGSWEYFRKECVYGEEEDIFTDNESKIELLIRIRRFYFLICVFLLCINMSNFANITNMMSKGFSSIGVFCILVYIVVIGLYLRIFVGISIKINRLKSNRSI